MIEIWDEVLALNSIIIPHPPLSPNTSLFPRPISFKRATFIRTTLTRIDSIMSALVDPSLLFLPNDVLRYILSLVGSTEFIARCRSVCKQWHTALRNDVLISEGGMGIVTHLSSALVPKSSTMLQAMIGERTTTLRVGPPHVPADYRQRIPLVFPHLDVFALFHPAQLTSLYVERMCWDGGFSPEVMALIGVQFPRLQKLTLVGRFSGEVLGAILTSCPHLQYFDLRGDGVTDMDIMVDMLPNVPLRVQTLRMCSVATSRSHLAPVIEDARFFHRCEMRFQGRDTLPKLLHMLPRLQELTLSTGTSITFQTDFSCLENCPLLTELEVDASLPLASWLPPWIRQIANVCTRLRTVSFKRLIMTQDDARILTQNNPDLRSISLVGMPSVTNGVIHTLVRGVSRIDELYLEWTRITDEAICDIIRRGEPMGALRLVTNPLFEGWAFGLLRRPHSLPAPWSSIVVMDVNGWNRERKYDDVTDKLMARNGYK